MSDRIDTSEGVFMFTVRVYEEMDSVDRAVALVNMYIYVQELEAALTPFAAVGAAVAARPAYPPTQELMRVGEASFTVAHLIAAADVLAVRAEAVTGGASGKGGISEHGEKVT